NLESSMNLLSLCQILSIPAALASGPYNSKCDWSEWRCLDRPDGVGCVASKSRLCCNGTAGCQVDSYVHKTLYSRADQLAKGIDCLQRNKIGLPDSDSSGSNSDHERDVSFSLSSAGTAPQAAATTCLARPRFDGSKFPPPRWCPWTQWSSWTAECRRKSGLESGLPDGLIELVRQLGNETDAFKYSSRSRGCYCPASPDPTYTCEGKRLDWRYKSLQSEPSSSSSSSGGSSLEPTVCHWCSWESWLPACTCPLPADFPKPRRRRSCLCFAGDYLIAQQQLAGDSSNGSYSVCGEGSNVQVAPSTKSVCPVCSHLHANYQVSQFLNPLAIGFAVYLLVALAAFLLCRLFCGNPRHSDANSRDQLSVDDFLASPPPADAVTSAV
ncbi:hypothetical protein BOX15_Mlig019245g3, partial [Macrostomum lignano]